MQPGEAHPLMPCRGDTLAHDSKGGSVALTAILTTRFRRQIYADLLRR